MDVTKFECFDILAGSSLGRSDVRVCREILDLLQEVSNDPINIHPPMDVLWREFATDLMDFDEDGEYPPDVDWYCNKLERYITTLLPVFTSIAWDDNELKIMPNIEEVRECVTCVTELPYDEENDKHLNPHEEDFIVVVNDHGNVTLYKWWIYTNEKVNGKPAYWKVVWAAV